MKKKYIMVVEDRMVKRMKQKIYGILVILWMVAIFMFSAQDADESSKMSMGVGETVGKVFVKEYESWSEERQLSFIDSVEFHQLFVPGRSGQITDVMIDSGGVILGILIYCLFRRIIGEKR